MLEKIFKLVWKLKQSSDDRGNEAFVLALRLWYILSYSRCDDCISIIAIVLKKLKVINDNSVSFASLLF